MADKQPNESSALSGMDRQIRKKRITPKRIVWAAGTVALVVVLVYAVISAGGSSTLRIDSSRVTISEVTRGDFLEFIPVNGTAVPIKTFYLDAIQGGQVVEVFLEEGSLVKKGDPILQLDNTDLQLDIMYREAQLFEQINNLRNTRLAMEQNSLGLRADLLEIDRQIGNSRRQFEQAQRLVEKKLISQYDFDKAKDDFDYWVSKRELTVETQRQDSVLRVVQIEQLELSVDRMQANLEIVKRKLDNLTVRAPIAGSLTSLDAEVGESKSRGERLGQIDQLDGFKVRGGVDEYYISRVSDGLRGEVTVAGKTYRLVVTKVYTVVRDGRFEIDLVFDGEAPEGIRRGQTLQLRLALGGLSEATLIARGGFYNTTGGHWIFVLDKSGEWATRRDISIGMYNPQVYEVLDGLQPGEQVITSSYENYEGIDRIVFSDR